MTIFRTMNRLLRLAPNQSIEAGTSLPVLAGALICFAIYAAAAGFFQGGWSVLLAAAKIPLIIFGSVLLCLPSLYIFTALAGSEVSVREFGAAVAGFCGIVGLILLALMPITWLFAVSSLSLAFVVSLHLFIWITALAFGRRMIAAPFRPSRGSVDLWITLLFLVSLQLTTYLRPVLWHTSGAPLIELEKQSFFTHLGTVIDFQPAPPPPLQHKVVERH
jgi:hypothetical protein